MYYFQYPYNEYGKKLTVKQQGQMYYFQYTYSEYVK